MNTEKTAVIVGGGSGIGLAIAERMRADGKKVIVVDKTEPENGAEFIKSDLLNFDAKLFRALAGDNSVDMLVITAGVGLLNDFENHTDFDIDRMIKVNAAAPIKIIRAFYGRIKSDESFYTAVIGSIAGLVSSPMYSVYGASKAAVCRFIESVNAEIAAAGFKNRILNASPGSVKGTRFNGGENDLSLLLPLADEIIRRTETGEALFIPDYESVYKGVLERYHSDSERFGLESYEYKKNSGRQPQKSKTVIGYLSGTFDLFHIGHLNLLRRAKERCDYLIVGVHPDASHKNKNAFVPFEERMEIVGSVKYVDEVVVSCREDSDAWEKYHFNRLFVGSDYKGTERFQRYEEFFRDKDAEIIYFPYTASTNSTQLRAAIENDGE